MNKRDREALQLAMVQARQGPDARGAQLDKMLERRPWEFVAGFASFHCQMQRLHLRPWDAPPCCTSIDDDDPDNAPAVQLLKRMRKAGVSRWHPSPLEAVEAAEKATSGTA
jgi:hypothetical protein